MKKTVYYRSLFYVLGLLVLALGLILNTKAGLGVSPIISVAYSISEIFHYNFGNTTLALYSLFVLIQMVLHLIRTRNADAASRNILAHAEKIDRRLLLFMDFLQIPLSLIFTRFMNLFSSAIPEFPEDFGRTEQGVALRILVLLLAVILTGIGAAMSLNVRLIPNPGDGIVQALSDCVGKSVGLTKNCFDLFNILLTTTLSLTFAGHLVGIGIGTILAMIGVGRTIAVFNRLFQEKMARAAGVERQKRQEGGGN